MSFTVFPKDTDIYLCKGVPFDPDYSYTVYFHNNIEQLNVISQYVHKTFNDQSYQRASRGVLRVAVLADEIYDCNYLYFKNTAHGNKYFFCFIKGVTYINDRTTEVEYVIDSLQTYWFDFSLPACFVEREHTLSDNIGDNVEPEPLPPTDFICSNYQIRTCQGSYGSIQPGWYIIVRYVPQANPSSDNVISDWYVTSAPFTTAQTIDNYTVINGVPMSYRYVAMPLMGSSRQTLLDTALLLSSIINQLVELSAVIVDVSLVPKEIGTDYEITNTPRSTVTNALPHAWTISQHTGFRYSSTNERYVPKNKKLYTSPYSKLVLSNNQGQSSEYKWENFTRADTTVSVTASFNIYNTLEPDCMSHCVPMAYNGQLDACFESGIEVANFPSLNWTEDSFQRWKNTNGTKWGLSLISTLLSSAFSIGKSAYVGYGLASSLDRTGSALLNGQDYGAALRAFQGAEKARLATDYTVARSGTDSFFNVAQLFAEREAQQATPDTLKGNAEGFSILMREERYGFSAYNMTICGELANTYDDFFSQFGYAINKIKVPNIMNANVQTVRPQWNYVKTRNCIVIPNQVQSSTYGMNSEIVKAIQGIFDNGITFWMNHQNVGKYNLSNNPPN